LRFDFARGFFYKVLRFAQIALRIAGQFFEALGDFLGLRAISVVLFLPVALDFSEARFEVAENFLAGRAHQRFKALLGKFMQLAKIVFANAFDARESFVDGFVEMSGERVLNDFFRRRLQFALHGGN
jgi:hypothetical protein